MLCQYLLISINELLISIISFIDINKYGLNVKTAAHRDLDRIWIAYRTPLWNHLLSRSTILMFWESIPCVYYTPYDGQPGMSLFDVF